MMYVNDRSADSICDTALLFFVMKSEYMPSHFGGIDRTSPVFCVACLYMSKARPDIWARQAVECAMGGDATKAAGLYIEGRHGRVACRGPATQHLSERASATLQWIDQMNIYC